MFINTKLIAAALTGLVALTPMAASANHWNRTHPGRTELNHRLAYQNRRITQERREGDITRGQAHALRADDHAVRRQERAYARVDHNHGHLNRGQVRQLNGELNGNSGAIGR